MSVTWVANTAYLATAVVNPTVFAGYMWRCTTAGTSAGVEPVWPAAGLGTDTIVDGTVTWTRGTGFRQQLANGIVTLLQTFSAANPTVVASVRTHRPAAFGSAALPCFYLGDFTETIDRPGFGPVTRTFDGFSCFVVDAMGTITDSAARQAICADALMELFADNPHLAGGQSVVELVGIIDSEQSDSANVHVTSLEFQFARTKITEGRG